MFLSFTSLKCVCCVLYPIWSQTPFLSVNFLGRVMAVFLQSALFLMLPCSRSLPPWLYQTRRLHTIAASKDTSQRKLSGTEHILNSWLAHLKSNLHPQLEVHVQTDLLSAAPLGAGTGLFPPTSGLEWPFYSSQDAERLLLLKAHE